MVGGVGAIAAIGIVVEHSAATVTTPRRTTTPIRPMVMDTGRRLASHTAADSIFTVVVATAAVDTSIEAAVVTGVGRA